MADKWLASDALISINGKRILLKEAAEHAEKRPPDQVASVVLGQVDVVEPAAARLLNGAPERLAHSVNHEDLGRHPGHRRHGVTHLYRVLRIAIRRRVGVAGNLALPKEAIVSIAVLGLWGHHHIAHDVLLRELALVHWHGLVVRLRNLRGSHQRR